MVANLAFRTNTGIRFFQVEDFDIRKMMAAISTLENKKIFEVTVSDGNQTIEMICTDIWADFRVFTGEVAW